MTDEELIARLRLYGRSEVAVLEAAARIEALTAKVKLMDDLDVINVEKIEALIAEQSNLVVAAHRQGYDQARAVSSELRRAMAERIMEHEVKLAKAQAALEKLATAQCFGSGEILGLHLPDTPMGREILARMDFARTTLSEIKGE